MILMSGFCGVTCRGEEAKLELNSDLGLAISQPVDLLEQPINLRWDSILNW